MSASITAAPARTSFGRFSLAIALMALAVVIAAAVALVALNGTKTAAPTTGTAAQYGQSVTNVPFYDHGWSKINEPGQSVTNVPFYDHGWSIAGTSTTPPTSARTTTTATTRTRRSTPPRARPRAPATRPSARPTRRPPASATRCPAPPTSPFASRRSTRAHAVRRHRVPCEPQYVAPRPRNQ